MNRQTKSIAILAAAVIVAGVTVFSLTRREPQEEPQETALQRESADIPGIKIDHAPGREVNARQAKIPKARVILSEEDLDRIDKKLEAEVDNYMDYMENDKLENLDETVSDEYKTAWNSSVVRPVASPIVLNEKIKEYEAIDIDKNSLSTVVAGDLVSIRLPGAIEYQVLVAEVTINQNGETSWNGYLAEYEKDYPVTFTLGAVNSFATVTTPEGLYSMEAFKGSGWVYKTPDTFELVDPDQPDNLVAEMHENSRISN